MNGLQPHIDATSSFDSVLPKKTRLSPAFGAGSPALIPAMKGYIAGQSTPYISSPSYIPNGGAPQSPLNLGGPLSTPIQSPSMAARPTTNGLNVSQTPFIGMMNGMNGVMGMGSFGIPAFPYNVNLVSILHVETVDH